MKMNTLSKLSLILTLGLAPYVSADDTEIFFNIEDISDTEAFQPNILFIFDTSGSMGDNIQAIALPSAAYDPNTNYGSSSDSYVYAYTQDFVYDNKVIKTKVSCKAMLDFLSDTDNESSPVYSGLTASYSSYYNDWSAFGWWDTNTEDYLECEDDEGTHGQTDASTDTYTAAELSTLTIRSRGNYYSNVPSSGAYSSSSANTVDWNQMQARNFVSANYHDYLQAGTTITNAPKTTIMKAAAIDLVDNFTGLNLGLMRFDGSSGGYVVHHFSDIETDSTDIKAAINALGASGNTPLAETMWEAHRYFAGLSPDYGTNSNRDSDAVSSGNYVSPVGGNDAVDCQSNYIVYLTDGNPYSDSGRDTQISNLDGVGTCSHSDGASLAGNTCLDEMAGYMADFDYNDQLTGVQPVKTYTIGFDIDMDLLEQTAISGDGDYYTANNSTELRNAFNEIVRSILSDSNTFVAPAVSVNAFNSLQNLNEVYYALFEPNVNPRWYGNIKKYKIASNGNVLDADDILAVDPDTGYFESESRSFWSVADDGPNVQDGGAANKLSESRTIYTVSGDKTASNISLNLTTNIIADDNSDITNALYGLKDTATTAERTELINWILGKDVEDVDRDNDTDDANHFMADPLHNRPVVVNYGGTVDNQDNTLFSMSNSGAFHAINTNTGEELFSFIPQDLLANQATYFNDDTDTDRIYGLDGPTTIWRHESNDDSNTQIDTDTSSSDHVIAYFGMRRGGKNYYALDVTDRANPILKWTIRGGSTGFQDLGQTWSKPVLGQINWDCDTDGTNCTKKRVLFFSGGYDTVHDTTTTVTTGDLGAAIYMVDADTGALLWSAGKNEATDTSEDQHDLNLPLDNSIPGDVTVADLDSDGLDDVVFAVDILGHVWRIDINSESSTAANFAKNENVNGVDTGAEIADLSDSTVLRRFYVGPTVSLSQKRGREPFFVITVGSGHMSNPKETDISDRLYAIFEYSVFNPPTDADGDISYTKISAVNNDLRDMSSPSADPADPTTNAPHGFFRDAFDDGEKFLRPALTLFGYTLYTSYLPEGNGGNVETTCGSSYLGGGRLYAIDFVTGKSVYVSNYVDLSHPGIPPQPIALFIPDDEGKTRTVLCVGTECFGEEDPENPPEKNPLPSPGIYKEYWRENKQ